MIDEDFALLRAADELKSCHLDACPPVRPYDGTNGAPPAFADTFWRRFARAAAEPAADQLISLWREASREQLDDPAYGLSAAIVFYRARTPALRAAVSPVLNRVLSTRQHWVTTHRIDPLAVLHHQAGFECGLRAQSTSVPTQWRCPVLTAEQLLPAVKVLARCAAPERRISAPA
ncbi:MAG: hypothetical protein LC098_12610 [Burkholderiales bacterium]|nr:hypothetical protein [Burkholderiales bacterium]